MWPGLAEQSSLPLGLASTACAEVDCQRVQANMSRAHQYDLPEPSSLQQPIPALPGVTLGNKPWPPTCAQVP